MIAEYIAKHGGNIFMLHLLIAIVIFYFACILILHYIKKTRTGKRYFKIGIPDWIELHTWSIVSLYLTIGVSIIPFLYDKELHFDAECILAFMLYFLIISTSFALFLGPHIIKNVDYIWGCSEIYDDYFYYSSILSLYKINRIKLKNIKKFRRTADRLAHGWVSIRTQDGKTVRIFDKPPRDVYSELIDCFDPEPLPDTGGTLNWRHCLPPPKNNPTS